MPEARYQPLPEREVTLYWCECGDVRETPGSHWAFRPGQDPEFVPCFQMGKPTQSVPVSVVAGYREALREIAEAGSLAEVRAIVANGPLATAPGGVREDECVRLREQLRVSQIEVSEIGRLGSHIAALTRGWEREAELRRRAQDEWTRQQERADSLALDLAALTARSDCSAPLLEILRDRDEARAQVAALTAEVERAQDRLDRLVEAARHVRHVPTPDIPPGELTRRRRAQSSYAIPELPNWDEMPVERCACGLVSRGLVDGVCADCRQPPVRADGDDR